MTTLWKWLCAIGAGILAVFTLGAWMRREAEGSGERKAKQEALKARLDEIAREAATHEQERKERLARAVEREREEAAARRKADEATATPEPAGPDAEAVLEAVRRQRRDVQ